MNRREMIASAVSAVLPLKAASTPKDGGHSLLGTSAPPLQLEHWLNSKPLEPADLRGKVVLLRWWTKGCPFCAATAPTLRTLETKYGARGFQVIGVYHPKPAGRWNAAEVTAAVKEKQFTFPVAIDPDWQALKRWGWQPGTATSVSFLLDKQGIIRYVHPGVEFHEGDRGGLPTHEACNRDAHFIDAEIVRLLSVR